MQLQISISNRLVFYLIIGGVTAQNIVINYQTSKMAEGLYHIEDNEVLISSSQPPLLLTEPPVLILSASSSSAAAAGAASKIKPTPATSMVLQTQKVTQQVHNSAASSVTQQISAKDSIDQLSQITVEDSVTNNDESATIGHALYWVFHLFNSSGYMLEVDEILKHFHYNRFFVTHQTWSKFNLKDWPENYKTILGSSIFIYVAIFCK